MAGVRCKCFLVLAVVSLGSALARSQTQVPQHPLEALKSQEYWTVYDVLHASAHLDADTSITSVLLHEPPKAEVLAWKPGDPVSRQAEAILLRKGLTIEVRVDIGSHQLLYWKERPDVQAPESEAEFRRVGEVIKRDPQFVQALAKRGIKDLTAVECEPVPYGYFAFPELEGRRIMYGGCADLHGAHLSWGREIEGLYVEIDAANEKVLRVIDKELVPVPTGSTNFEEAPEKARAGTTPLETRQPLGPSFRVANGEVTWQNWHFRFRLDPRVGPVIN
jgi:primary-amine oxidase